MTKKSTAVVVAGEGNAVEAQRLNLVSAQFGIVTDDLAELTVLGADSLNRAMFEVCRAGIAFMKVQHQLSMGHGGDRKNQVLNSELESGGGFVAWIEQHGLARARVYEAMKIAKFVTQLPSEQLDDVLSLGKVKVALLASLPPDIIDAAANNENGIIDRADLMTVAELKLEVNDLKRREKNYEAELERAEMRLQRLTDAKKRTTEFLERTEDIREECMALQLGGQLSVESLRKLFDEVNPEGPNGPEWRLQIEQVWVAAHVLASRALGLVEYMRDTVHDSDMPEHITGTHILSVEEAQRWILDYPMIENRYAVEAAARQEKRDAEKPAKRGRPSGSKNKSKE